MDDFEIEQWRKVLNLIWKEFDPENPKRIEVNDDPAQIEFLKEIDGYCNRH